jgi:NADH-quinone oxidoreductase subunit M
MPPYKFFIFTQAGGLLMLLSILALYFINGSNTGTYTFDYFILKNIALTFSEGRWIMLGFLIAFIIKLPVVPFHSWLPDAHSEAPSAGSLILAGLLLKTGAYGIIRFVITMFPENAAEISQWAMLFGVIGIIYGAMLAFAQTDLKRFIAYTSVSHMGFCTARRIHIPGDGFAGRSDADAYAWRKYRSFICYGRNDQRAASYERHRVTWVDCGPACP